MLSPQEFKQNKEGNNLYRNKLIDFLLKNTVDNIHTYEHI